MTNTGAQTPGSDRDKAARQGTSHRNPSSGSASKKSPLVSWMWYIIGSVILLIVSMILPIVLSPSMQMYFRAKVESVGESDGAFIDLLPGSVEETLRTTNATEYKARFTPRQLENDRGTFTFIEILYGPVLVTGSPLNLVGTSTENDPDFSSNTVVNFSTFWLPGLFYIILIVVLILMLGVVKKQPEAIKFVITLTIIWILWALIAWVVSGMAFGKVSDMLNQLLTDEQGSARYSLNFLSVIMAPIRVFLVGIVVIVLATLFKKSQADKEKDNLRFRRDPKT